MLRIPKLVQRTSQKFSQNAFIVNALNRAGKQRLVSVHRFYSDEHDDRRTPERDRSGACPPDPAPCKPPKPALPIGKTIHPLHPCVNPGKPYPTDYDCPTENLMDKLPQREMPYAAADGRRKRYYFIVLAIGTVVLLTSAYAAYQVIPPRPIFTLKKKRLRPHVPKKNPISSSVIPKDVQYLLIGGGTASFSAFRAIKSSDPTAKILVISTEADFPYMRPPLSKEMWFNSNPEDVENLTFKQWNGTERSIFYEPEDFYVKVEELDETENGGVAVARGWSVKNIDVIAKKAFLEDGKEIGYGKCLIATGAKPKNLDIFSNAEPKMQNSVTLFREIFDYQELADILEEVQSIAIIGGGFLGSEIACAVARAKREVRVSQIFKEEGNMGKVLPEYLSSWTTEKVKLEGVNVVPQAEVIGAKFVGNQIQLTLNNQEELKVDHVIVAVGAKPNTSLAEASDLEVDPDLGGYLVNTELQARSNLYIAGDCACFYDTKFGRRRVEHHDHAVVSGRLAGENMTGASKPYWHQSMFWSDLGPDVGYEAIGIVDAKLPTVGVFAKATELDTPKAVVEATNEAMRCDTEENKTEADKGDCKTNEIVPPECKDVVRKDQDLTALAEQIKKQNKGESEEDYGKGVVFYLRDDIVVGIVLWNVFNRMNIARQVLKEERKYEDLNEVAKLFNIHEE